MDYIDDTVGWGASLEAEFQDNTNWDFDVSDEDDLDQFGGDVFSELAELEHMVQQCTLAEPGGYAMFRHATVYASRASTQYNYVYEIVYASRTN